MTKDKDAIFAQVIQIADWMQATRMHAPCGHADGVILEADGCHTNA
jgi:hypothetical protein